ncbi:DUF167 family protein [Caulobacter hibisci]|uniref:UPF0235 protein I4Q42_19970 n=1 Tax=Caulobacter hibisci TaxID=2035993 RepID=A0ABS0T248_9CAUL|nr:DUF167 family protein [Caulobacter hibisci]MBI1685952.1 DUF167 domain-containing protein [Caulobacter hibisci]
MAGADTAVLAVRLTPRGGRDAVDGWAADADGRPYLKVRVSAPPVEGEANAALTALLAKRLGVSRSAVRVASGATARLKRLEVEGLAQDALDRLLDRPEQAP